MKNIAVLGSGGQLGQTLKSTVKDEKNFYNFFTRESLDITNKQALELVFSEQKFDFCVNCAAYTNVEGAETDVEKAFLINSEGAKNLAEVCKNNGVKLIHISTDYVFDGKKDKPYTTRDKTNPINQYGKSKLRGESYIKDILDEYYIIRTSWLYSLYGKNFLKTIVNKIKENKTLTITIGETGTPTSCVDLSSFINHIIISENIPYGIYNFSARGCTTWYGLALEITKKIYPDRIANISPVDSFKTIAKRPKYSVLDITETEKVYKDLNTWQKSVEALIKRMKT